MLVGTSIYGGGEMGTDSVTTVTHAHGTSAHTLNQQEIPAHTHALQSKNSLPNGTVTFYDQHIQQQFVQEDEATWDNGNTQYAGGGQPHSHGNTLSVLWRPLISFVIVAQRDA
jgi:microcystin-dependent protein